VSEEHQKANMSLGQKIGSFISGGIYNEKESKVKKRKRTVVHEALPKFNPDNIQCFFELMIGYPNEPPEDTYRGRVVFELFDQELPYTCENFRSLCAGEKSQQHHYQGTRIHRVVTDYCMTGGDTSAAKDGEGGRSIYTEADFDIYAKDGLFDDEPVWYPHSHRGTISMHNKGPNANGSQFLI
jgi:cyclophilin family peptidyl-prolyl cis-trans isomerase